MDPFLGEIRIFAGGFAPFGWMFCNGQILPIVQYSALFSLLGAMYGGDGKTTFALPDLRGRAPMHAGQGPGLSYRDQGVPGGAATHTLTAAEAPPHSHAFNAGTGGRGNVTSVAGASPANTASGTNVYSSAAASATMNATMLSQSAGGSTPHENQQPYLAMNFIIAYVGIYPVRG